MVTGIKNLNRIDVVFTVLTLSTSLYAICTRPKFQADASWMALSTNQIATKISTTNQKVASNYHLGNSPQFMQKVKPQTRGTTGKNLIDIGRDAFDETFFDIKIALFLSAQNNL